MSLNRGFSFLELLVVVAILVALAGVLVPVVNGELEASKKATAQASVNRIATALTEFIKDTSFAPTGEGGKRTYHVLHSDGAAPRGSSFTSGEATTLERFLCRNELKVENWHGPYLRPVGSDPWGGRYVVNSHGFFTNDERVWILSAGPNGRLETSPGDSRPGGDDIGLFLE